MPGKSVELRLSDEACTRLFGEDAQVPAPVPHGLELRFDSFNYLGIWTASTKAPFIALEPWIGVADCVDEDGVFEHKRGTRRLAPHESQSFQLGIIPF